MLVGDPVTSCAAAGNLTYNQSLTQALSINFTVYPSNAVDAQTLTPAAFSIPGGEPCLLVTGCFLEDIGLRHLP